MSASPGPSALYPGLRVTPNIELVKRLGAGGMGSVWIAQHHGINTQVVVKFMAEHLVSSPEMLARFAREAAAAAQVKSPHVVQTFDHGVTESGLPFIAMELLEGETLSERLEAERMMPPREVAGLIQQAARALQRAHERGVVHRDIKPDNIFLCDAGSGEGFLKVLDFGIAKSTAADALSMTKTGAMMGTPYYMSPEQVMGRRDVDHQSDLWALGVLTFEALTGQRPFEAETLGALSVMICTAEVPRPSSFAPHLPPSIDAWFARACARNPAERFPDAKTFADELASACGGIAPVRLLRGQAAPHAPATRTSPTADTTHDISAAPAPPMVTTGGAAMRTLAEVPEPPRKNTRLLAVGGLVALTALAGAAFLLGRGSLGSTTAGSAQPAGDPAPRPSAVAPTASPSETAAQPPPAAAASSAAPVPSAPPASSAAPKAPSPATTLKVAGPSKPAAPKPAAPKPTGTTTSNKPPSNVDFN